MLSYIRGLQLDDSWLNVGPHRLFLAPVRRALRFLPLEGLPLELLAPPAEPDRRAALPILPVAGDELRTAALQKRLGDEEAEAEAAGGAAALAGVAAARRHIGLAEPLEHVGREAGPIVGISIQTSCTSQPACTATVVVAKSTALSIRFSRP